MVTAGSSLLYAEFHPKAKVAERMPKKCVYIWLVESCCTDACVFTSFRLSQLTETISKKPIPQHVKHITLEVMAEDENEEDVEVSYSTNIVDFSLRP
jgi:ubiquitin-activating enzyme E1